MFPVYRCMDPYSHQSNQMPFSRHYQSNSDAIPPQMQVDPAKFSLMRESWPYGGGYGYPMPCHACCNQNTFPGYYSFRQPYFNQPPQLPLHCCGYHPAFQEAYPVHYIPPHFTMEQPRYEYDKDMPRNYFCYRCPNHKSIQEENKGVKIEEHESDVQEKGNGALIPSQLENFPYPILWIPPDYRKDKERSKPMESEVDHDKPPQNSRPPESLKSFGCEPRVLNGVFPFDMNSLGNLVQGGDRKGTQNQHTEEKKSQFPIPVFWVPSYDRQEEAERDRTDVKTVSKSGAEAPSNFNANTVQHPDSGNTINISVKHPERADKGNSGSQVGPGAMTENTCQKSISVKQSEAREENSTEDTERKRRDVPVKHIENNSTKKLFENKKQSLFPPKTRLPPICLRVDPLPGRKNCNSSSRSPSPPGLKGCSQEGNVTGKVSASSVSNEHTWQDLQAQKNSKEVETETNKEQKVTEVVEGTGSSTNIKNGNSRNGSKTQLPVILANYSQEEISRGPSSGKTEKDSDECVIEQDKGMSYEGGLTPEKEIEAKEATDGAKSSNGKCEAEKKALSDSDAAIIIQSAYRGFVVRKWELIKKLKQLAKVHNQVIEVRNQIQALQSSSDLQSDDRQRLVIGEMIMSLLLKLDTIQGLPPSFRDVRKSMATELVNLQEKLDSLVINESDKLHAKVSTASTAEDQCFDTHDEVCMKDKQNQETEQGPGGNSSEIASAPLGKENSKQLSEDLELHKRTEDETNTVAMASGAESNVAELAPIMEPEDKADNGEFEPPIKPPSVAGVETETNSEVECKEPLVEDSCHDPDEEYESRDAKVNDQISMNDNAKVDEPGELQQVAVAEEPASDSEKNEQNGTGENDVAHSEVESILRIDSALPSELGDLTLIKVPETDQLAQLSVGMIEADAGVSEPANHEQVEMENPTDVISLEDDPLAVNKLEHQSTEAPEGGLLADDTVKFETQKNEKLPRDAAVELEAEQPLAKEVCCENELSIVTEPEKIHPVCTVMEKESHFEVHKEKEGFEKVNVDDSHASELADMQVTTKGKEAPITKTDEKEEEEMQKENEEFLGEEFVNNKTADQLMTQTVKVQDEAGMQNPPEGANEAEVQSELVPMSPTSGEVSIDECGIGMVGDKNSIKENEKLREMMEKLIQNGKQQLTVISDLTGRVKDLEKKLSRKNKLTKRYKVAKSRSCVKPSHNALMERAVAMGM